MAQQNGHTDVVNIFIKGRANIPLATSEVHYSSFFLTAVIVSNSLTCEEKNKSSVHTVSSIFEGAQMFIHKLCAYK